MMDQKRTFNGTAYLELFAKVPKIDRKANERNIHIFDQRGTGSSGERRHTCVICGNKTNIDSSCSSRGSLLTCTQCIDQYFEGDYAAFSDWAMGGYER